MTTKATVFKYRKVCVGGMGQTIFGCLWEAKFKQKFGRHGKVDFPVI